MNAPISRSSAALLVIGSVAILLLGAFSRFDSGAVSNSPPSANVPAAAPTETPAETTFPANLPPGVAEIFRMAQAHVDENVILAFIKNSGQAYSLTADQILYLADLGLSQKVISALVKQKPAAPTAIAAAVPTSEPTPPPVAAQENTADLFHDALAPYGTWSQSPDYGAVWQPTAETINADWRPYVDQGQWISSGTGWYWQSGYSWGWAAFHYGRWAKTSTLGWVWVPNNIWGPAWVSWRIALSYAGWAPLPPGVGLAEAASFTFVPEDNFLSRNLPSYAVPASQTAPVYTKSLPVISYSLPLQKALNLGPDTASALAAAAIKPVPSRIRDEAVEPQIQPIAYQTETPTTPISRPHLDFVEIPRTAPPIPSPVKTPSPKVDFREAENRDVRWKFPETPRPPAPVQYEPVAERIEATQPASSSKSGK